MTLRQPTAADWSGIHHVANQALPWAADSNAEWLRNRQQFDASGHPRCHYVAEDAQGHILGYATLEGGTQRGRFRLFLVMGPDLLRGPVGELLYEQLARDLRDLEASVVWAREEAQDTALRTFLQERGFAERQRFAVDGLEMVLLERPIA